MTESPNQLFASARLALSERRFAACQMLVERLKVAVGPHPAILHLEALCASEIGQEEIAARAFRAAIELSGSSADPALLANFARFLWAKKDFGAAQDWLEKAAIIARDDRDIQIMHINAVRRNHGDKAGLGLFDEILSRRPDDSAMWHHKALFLRDAGQHMEALSAIEKALAANSKSNNAAHLRARLLLDLGMDSEEAFSDCHFNEPGNEDIVCGWAAARFQSGKLERALALLDDFIVAHAPAYSAIEARFSMTHQAMSADQALSWIGQICADRPEDRELLVRWATMVRSVQGASQALSILGPSDADKSVGDRILRAELLSDAGEFAQAESVLEELRDALDHAPARLRMVRPINLFRLGRIEEATELAHKVGVETGLIEAWAFVEAGWRKLADPRWDWLMAEGRLVQCMPLRNFEDYQAGLVADLKKLHAMMRNQPYEQSVRGGTQTDGFLLGRQEESIKSLRLDLDHAIASYIDGLNTLSDDHPLAKLKNGHGRIVGSWSVLLRSAGKHASHFHNQGLISSACYVSLPDSMNDAGEGKSGDGWLEFGRPPEGSGLPPYAFDKVEPREGSVALFPSFLFHGTVPFSEGERLTVAFDVADIAL